MRIISDPDAFVCGLYLIVFDDEEQADRFIDRYRPCPCWVIVERGTSPEEVFVVAIELEKQAHGYFMEENNTLVQNPHYLGAREVRFVRNDHLLKLFLGHRLQTGYAAKCPCGSDCNKCQHFKSPCNGCPAVFEY